MYLAQNFRPRLSAFAVACAFGVSPMLAHASGFALMEQNASGLGNAFAGAGAVAEDASTVFYNPAGLTYLSGRQVVFGMDLIDPSAKFSDSGSLASGTGSSGGAALRPLGGNGGNAGSLSFVPDMYLAWELTPQWHLGLGINSPFGQKTQYSPDWEGRFQGIKSEIDTYNINPTVAYKVNDQFSLGLGADYQHIKADFSQGVNYQGQLYNGLIAAGQTPAGAAGIVGAVIPAANAEGSAEVTGSASAWGWNAGAMWQLNPQTRLGLSYRSAIKYTINGTVTFNNAPTLGAAFAPFPSQVANGNITSAVKVPQSASIALNHQLNDRWKIMGDISWTGWSSIQSLTFVRDTGVVLSSTPENFRDTWRVGVGATYRMDEKWSLRGGLAYDQTPVSSAYITPRLPDQNRYWLAIGAQYRFSPTITGDVGYTHIFMNNQAINQNAGNTIAYGQLSGSYSENTNILGAQVSFKF